MEYHVIIIFKNRYRKLRAPANRSGVRRWSVVSDNAAPIYFNFSPPLDIFNYAGGYTTATWQETVLRFLFFSGDDSQKRTCVLSERRPRYCVFFFAKPSSNRHTDDATTIHSRRWGVCQKNLIKTATRTTPPPSFPVVAVGLWPKSLPPLCPETSAAGWFDIWDPPLHHNSTPSPFITFIVVFFFSVSVFVVSYYLISY
jgi:hypothetical protein